MFLNVCKQTFHISHLVHISKSKRYFNVKFSTYYFHIKAKIYTDFRICINVPLRWILVPLFICFQKGFPRGEMHTTSLAGSRNFTLRYFIYLILAQIHSHIFNLAHRIRRKIYGLKKEETLFETSMKLCNMRFEEIKIWEGVSQ